MKSLLSMLFVVGLAWSVHARAIEAEVVGEKCALWHSPVASGAPAAWLKGGALVKVLSRTPDKRWLRVQARGPGGTGVQGYVLANEVLLTDAKLAPAPLAHEENDHEIRDPWSLGFGLSGYSTIAGSYFLVSGDARYLWNQWTESVTGVQLGFGVDTQIGAHIGQRGYFPINSFRPYVQLGFRRSDIRYSASSAWEMGGGFQVSYRGNSFFELSALYLWRTAFSPYNMNGWAFSGGSGIRF